MFAVENLWGRIRLGSSCRVFVNEESRAMVLPGQREGQVRSVKSMLDGTAVEINLQAREQGDFGILSATLRNTGKEPVQIGDIVLFSHQEDGNSDNPATRLERRCLFGFQDTLAYNYVSKVVSKRHGCEHTSKPLCLIYNLPEKKIFFAAQLTFDCNNVTFHTCFSENDATLTSMECCIAGENCTLSPGQEITTDEVALYLGGAIDPYALLCKWADAVHEIYQPELPDHGFAGLTGGTMIGKAETMCTKIRRQLTMAASLHKLGLEYFWISISNLKDGLPGNWLVPNEKNFPDGLQTILQEIQDTGLKPGFWMNPFYMAEGSADFERMKPWLIRVADGQPASRGAWAWGKYKGDGSLPQLYALDPAYPESLEYIGSIFRQYNEWGIRYYMLDFLGAGLYDKDEQKQGFGCQHFLHFMRSLKDFQAPGTHRLIATGACLKMVGAASSSRIGLDYCEGRSLEPHFPSYPANYVINGSFGSSGAPNRNAVNNLAVWVFAHGRFFNCNSNMLTVDKPIPLQEARIATTLFGISPSPVFFGDDLARMAPDRLAMLKMVLPRGKKMPMPIDLFTRTNVDDDFIRIFVSTIEKSWGKWHVVTVFNLNADFRNVDLEATALGLQPDASYRMYDFWEETYCGLFQGRRQVQVPGNNCAVFRMEILRPHPWILSTDMHILQGEAELQEVCWDEETMILKGRMQRAAGEKGNLFLIAPDDFRERNFNRNLVVAKSALDNSLVIRKRMNFEQDCEDWAIEFERWK